jgi:Glycosyl transferase family 90
MQIIDWLREHDEEAHRIALAGQAFAQRHLTRPGRLCYLRKLLHTYASLLRCRRNGNSGPYCQPTKPQEERATV